MTGSVGQWDRHAEVILRLFDKQASVWRHPGDRMRHLLAGACGVLPAPGGCADWLQLEPGWCTLPFTSAAFDAVVAASVLKFVAEPAAALAECARVVRLGGVPLYTMPELQHPSGEWSGSPSCPRRRRHRLRWVARVRVSRAAPSALPWPRARVSAQAGGVPPYRSSRSPAVTAEVIVDAPGARMGRAARYLNEGSPC